MPLKIVYIAGELTPKKKRERKPTEKELLHMEAIASMARYYALAEDRAKKLFEPEERELIELRANFEKTR